MKYTSNPNFKPNYPNIPLTPRKTISYKDKIQEYKNSKRDVGKEGSAMDGN